MLQREVLSLKNKKKLKRYISIFYVACNIFDDSILLKNWETLELHVLETTVDCRRCLNRQRCLLM